MKTAFRQQASNYDCAPTSIINALKYLFFRKDIPPFVVQRIYMDCLDIESFRGTSSGAMHDVSHWLNAHRDDRYLNFAVKASFIRGKQVHLRANSKIFRCIEKSGAALLCLHTSRSSWHYVMCFRTEGDWLYCYDPAPRSKRYINHDAVEFIDSHRQEPNLRIRSDWLDRKIENDSSYEECKYVFGAYEHRECLLLNRIIL